MSEEKSFRRKLGEFFQFMSSLVMIGAFSTYVYQATQGDSTPNPATWTISFVTALFNYFTFQVFAEGKWYKKITPLVVTILFGVVVVYSAVANKFTALTVYDWICAALCVLVALFWYWPVIERRFGVHSRFFTFWTEIHKQWWGFVIDKAVITFAFVQLIFFLAFLPTIIGVLNGNAIEGITAWIIAVAGYGVLLLGQILAHEKRQDILEMFYPVVNGIMGNGSIVLMCLLMS
jgi:hypothetical protein